MHAAANIDYYIQLYVGYWVSELGFHCTRNKGFPKGASHLPRPTLLFEIGSLTEPGAHRFDQIS